MNEKLWFIFLLLLNKTAKSGSVHNVEKITLKEPIPKMTDKPILLRNSSRNYVLENLIENILSRMLNLNGYWLKLIITYFSVKENSRKGYELVEKERIWTDSKLFKEN